MTVTLNDVGFDNVTDPVVKKALEDALKASAVTGGRRRGGGPKEDAARRTSAAARAVSATAVAEPAKLKTTVDTAIAQVNATSTVATAARAAVPVVAVGATGLVAVNNPTLLANLAEVIAVSLSEITNLAFTSTYSDWGRAIVGIGRGIGVIGTTGALQAGQGPVVPFAIATAIMTWRAQSQGRSLFEQIRADATGAGAAAAAAASSVASSAMKAVRPDPMAALFEITERARQIKVAGAGAEDLKELVRTELGGVPAARGGPAGVSLVPARAREDPAAPLRSLGMTPFGFDPAARSREASVRVGREARGLGAAGDGDAGKATGKRMGRPVEDEDEDGDDELDVEEESSPKRTRKAGRRSTVKKGKKVKRRTTRRKAPATIKFAY